MTVHIEEISGPHLLGEGPHWDETRQCLFYVDSFDATICRYSPAEKKLYTCKVGTDPKDHVSIVIPVKGQTDKFLVSLKTKLTLVTWDGQSTTPSDIRVLTSVDNEPGLEKNLFNDGKVDPTGRLWVGTLGGLDEGVEWKEGVGTLYSFSETLVPTKRESNITISNGMAWSADKKFMYYIDTVKKTVDVFDFDSDTGVIGNRRPVFDLTSLPELPEYGGGDGMTIDENGNLWVAVFGAGGVYQIDPREGKLLRRVEIPLSPHTTSVAFGGANLDELFVVTATYMMGDRIAKFPGAGKTFRVTGLGVKGLPMLPIDLSKVM